MIEIKIEETEPTGHIDEKVFSMSEDEFEDQSISIMQQARSAAIRGEKTVITIIEKV